MPGIISIDDASLEALTQNSQTPVLVAIMKQGPWCRYMAPVLEQMAAKCSDQMTFAIGYKTENTATVERYDITGYPTLIVYSGGEKVKLHSGFMNGIELLDFLRPWLTSDPVTQ